MHPLKCTVLCSETDALVEEADQNNPFIVSVMPTGAYEIVLLLELLLQDVRNVSPIEIRKNAAIKSGEYFIVIVLVTRSSIT